MHIDSGTVASRHISNSFTCHFSVTSQQSWPFASKRYVCFLHLMPMFYIGHKMLNHIIQHPRPWHNQKQAAISNIVLQSCMYNFATGKFCISIYHLDINFNTFALMYFISVLFTYGLQSTTQCHATQPAI